MKIDLETGSYITFAYFVIGVLLLAASKREIIPTAARELKREVQTNFTEDDLIEMMWLIALFLWLPAFVYIVVKRIIKKFRK